MIASFTGRHNLNGFNVGNLFEAMSDVRDYFPTIKHFTATFD